MTDLARCHRIRANAVPWQEIDGEIIALDPGSSNYVSINGSGTLLWRALVKGATVDELAQQLADAYGLEHDRSRKDAEAFVSSLAAYGWLDS